VTLVDEVHMASDRLSDFSQHMPLDGNRAWTAIFDSYDQRNDDCYYLVTLYRDGAPDSQFMVQIGMWWAGDDWTSTEFIDRLKSEISAVAATGKSNTDYTGSVASWAAARKKP
jgi:hypothetical protein